MHPIQVVRCTTHGGFFTIYPSGFARHQRLSVVQTEYGTGNLFESGEDLLIQEERPPEAFRNTQFQGALDASEGKAWARKWEPEPRKWWETQRRHIAGNVSLLGLDPGMDDKRRLEIAEILGMDNLLIAEEKKKLAIHPGYQTRGKAVVRILNILVKKDCPVERLLIAGNMAGRWGVPLWWDEQVRIIRKIPFRLAGPD